MPVSMKAVTVSKACGYDLPMHCLMPKPVLISQ